MKSFKEFKTDLEEDQAQDHADFYAGKDPKKRKPDVPPKDPRPTKKQMSTGIAGQKGNTGNNENE